MNQDADDTSKWNRFATRPFLFAVAAAVLVATAIAVLTFVAWQVAPVLLLFFAGVLAAILLRGIADWLSRWTGLSSGWAVTATLLLLTALAIAAGFTMGHTLASQFVSLSDEVPRSLNKLKENLGQYEWGERLLQAVPQQADELSVSGRQLTGVAATVFSTFTGGIAALVITLFLALYLAYDPDTYFHGGIRLLPVRVRPRIEDALGEVHLTLRWWLIGKMISMILIGVMTTIGLWMLGVPVALALGVLAAVLTFVPNFGPILSAIPAVLLALVESPMNALYVIILYVVIQGIESYLITPLIQQRTVSLPPGLTISAQIGMGILFGVPGVVLATPLTAMTLVLVRRLYVEDTLEAPD